MTLIESEGYPAEKHVVTTEDGYVLTMFRIPKPGRPPVFLQHGILSLSSDWLIYGKHKSLAFKLADAGFDVWLGNARSSHYSTKHEKYSVKQKEFWDFTFFHKGYYDLPAMIDYVLSITKKPKLHYIGHSQGATAFFVMTSTRKEMNNKIKSMHAIGPAAFIINIQDFYYNLLLTFSNLIYFFSNTFGFYEHKASLIDFFLLLGKSVLNLPQYFLKRSVSWRNLEHYAQLVRYRKFQMFDWGKRKNLKKYNRKTPPEFNLSAITAPVYLYYSDSDRTIAYQDVFKLATKLKNLRGNYLIKGKSHAELLWNMEGKNYFYKTIIKNIKRLENKKI